MVFQVIIVGGGAIQVDVPFFCQQQFLGAIFIDHISAVVRCCGCTIYYMHRAKLSSISCVELGDIIAITECNYLEQR